MNFVFDNINMIIPVFLMIVSFLAYVISRRRGNKALADAAFQGMTYCLKTIVRELDVQKKELKSAGNFDAFAEVGLKHKALNMINDNMTIPARHALETVLGITETEIGEMIEEQVQKNKEE
jgi:hypothetical protein